MDLYPPINLSWYANKKDPEHLYLRFTESGVNLFEIRPIRTTWKWFKRIDKVEYMVRSDLKSPGSGLSIGGYFSTLEEAKTAAGMLAGQILRGSDATVTERRNDESVVEPAEAKQSAKEREIEQSWANNPDRMGGQFTQDEINDSGWH